MLREEVLSSWKSCKEVFSKLKAKSIDNYPETTFYVAKKVNAYVIPTSDFSLYGYGLLTKLNNLNYQNKGVPKWEDGNGKVSPIEAVFDVVSVRGLRVLIEDVKIENTD